MAIPTNHYQSAYAKFRADLAAAVSFHDADFTHNAITRKRHEGVMRARADLLNVIPSESAAPTTTRATVIAGLAPKTADAVAVQGRELAIVERLLATGQPIEGIIRTASPERLAAIASNAEVLPSVLGSSEGPKVIEGIHRDVFDRLVTLGDPAAENVTATETIYGTNAAWRQFLKEAIEGVPGGAARTDLFSADPEGYHNAMLAESAGALAPSDIDRKVAQLDRTVAPTTAGA